MPTSISSDGQGGSRADGPAIDLVTSGPYDYNTTVRHLIDINGTSFSHVVHAKCDGVGKKIEVPCNDLDHCFDMFIRHEQHLDKLKDYVCRESVTEEKPLSEAKAANFAKFM